MFKNIIKGLLAGITIKLMDNWRRVSLQLLKIEAAKIYLQGVQMARWSMISLMRMGLAIGLIGVGMLLFHAGLFILLPSDRGIKGGSRSIPGSGLRGNRLCYAPCKHK